MDRLCNARWGVYTIEQIDQLVALSRDHHRVSCALVTPEIGPALWWCEDHVQGMWAYSRRSILMTESEAKRLYLRNTSPELFDNGNYAEDMMMEALAEDLQREIDYDILEQIMQGKADMGMKPMPRPEHWFFFADKEEAIKFQIRWGIA